MPTLLLGQQTCGTTADFLDTGDAVAWKWVAAAALVHGIGEIALAFQIHQGRHGITAMEGLADQLGVTNNHPAPDAAVPGR